MEARGSPAGSLTVVGTGIGLIGRMTLEALAHIERADRLLYLVIDPLMEAWIRERNPNAEPLDDCYAEGKPRSKTYREMADRALAYVRQGLDVVMAFYGHPGVFADPSHRALRMARREGYRAVMLPGVSAEGCLWADLGVDPGDRGWQSYEATDFLNRRPRIDTSCPLLLWQISVIGVESITTTAEMEGVRELTRALLRRYPAEHRVVVYVAPEYPICKPTVRRVALRRLPEIEIPLMSSLYVPAVSKRRKRKKGRKTAGRARSARQA